MNPNFTNAQIAEVCVGYQRTQLELQTSGMFDQKDDFTLVVQQFVDNTIEPPLKANHFTKLQLVTL